MDATPKAVAKPDLRARKRRKALLAVLVAPALAHVIAVTISATLYHEGRSWDRMDWAAHGAVAAYVILALILAFRRPRAAAKLALLAYAGIFALLLAEAALRMMAPAWPPYNVPWPKMQRVAEASDTMPGITGEIRFTTNSIGLRGPEPGDLKQYDHRILCVGGSTTECIYVNDEDSWPWALQLMLEKQTGRKICVGNSGRSGQFTGNHAYVLREYHFAPEFDWVVVLAGINDLGLFLQGTYDKRIAQVPEVTLVHPSGFAAKPQYYRLSEVGKRVTQLKRRFFPEQGSIEQDPGGEWYDDVRRQRRDALKKGALTKPPPGVEVGLERYEQGLMEIISACRDRGQHLVLMTQPTMWRADLPPSLEDLLWAVAGDRAYSPGVLRLLMDAYNERMKKVADRESVELLDLASMLEEDTTTFYDDCHFNTSGSRKVAAILSKWFVTHLEK